MQIPLISIEIRGICIFRLPFPRYDIFYNITEFSQEYGVFIRLAA